MEYLLSQTSAVRAKHTELAQIIENTPIMDCGQLRDVANRAVASYFAPKNAHRAGGNVEKRVKAIAHNIISATTVIYEDLMSDSDNDDLDPDTLFDTVILDKNSDEDIKVDRSLQDILENMQGVSLFGNNPHTTYLFRLATNSPEVNLVTEFHRFDDDDDNKGYFNPYEVLYTLHFAGYDVVQ